MANERPHPCESLRLQGESNRTPGVHWSMQGESNFDEASPAQQVIMVAKSDIQREEARRRMCPLISLQQGGLWRLLGLRQDWGAKSSHVALL